MFWTFFNNISIYLYMSYLFHFQFSSAAASKPCRATLKPRMTPLLATLVFIIGCASAHQNQQPYQAPPQPAYQQQVPQHAHQQAAGIPQGTQQPPQGGHVQHGGQPQQGGHVQHGGQPQQGGHVQHGGQPQQGGQPNLLRDKTHVHDREHIKEHLQGVVNTPDVGKMTEEELQFHYFKMHDNDDNNKLDGCELIKSVLHWHVEESNAMGPNAPQTGTTKIFQDGELALMIDPILDMDDRNKDGFIDYPEFVNAQKSRGF